MMNKHLLQIISILELFFLIILGVLSNKVAELLQIDQTFLWAITLFVVIALIAITIYKNNPSAFDSSNHINKKLDVKITKKVINGILTGIIYYPSALMLAKGAFAYSQAIDKNWLGVLSGSIVSVVLIFALLLFKHIKEEKQSILPFTIGFLLSLVYGTIGLYIDIFPEFFSSNILILAMISAATFIGLKYVFLYYTFFTWFGK